MDGTWSLPKSLEFSVQGLEFLDSLLRFEEKERPEWPEVKKHLYLDTDKKEYVLVGDLLSSNDTGSQGQSYGSPFKGS